MAQPLAIGCMRLSTTPVDARSPDDGIAVIHAALDAGVRLLDTADVYAPTDDDTGHNERLVARALATWSGPAAEVLVATKGGLTRPGKGRWVPNAKPDHLRAACAHSLEALGGTRISLYQLHTPDAETAMSSSVRALLGLVEEGLVERIGLCNVTRRQLEEALELADISAVQVALSPFDEDALFGGLVELCVDREIMLLAHSPLGGPKRSGQLVRDKVLGGIARHHGQSPAVVVLSWLRDLAPAVVPLPGPTRIETARATAATVSLDDEDRAALDARFRGGVRLRTRPSPPTGDGEVVLLMGIPGAGKSQLARGFAEEGYAELNRDARGGRLVDLLPDLEAGLAAGQRRWVLDNTYATRAARGRVIDVARRHRAPVRCVWLKTPLFEAQVNAVRRLLGRYGELPDAERLKKLARTDPHAFDPRAQFRFERELDPPRLDEGFAAIEELPFVRTGQHHTNEAIILQIEGVLRSSKSGARTPLSEDDVVVAHERAAALRAHGDRGCRLLGLSWQPAIAEGRIDRATAEALLAGCARELGVDIEMAVCPHGGGPPRCWCRTPLPGLAVAFIDRHRLDPPRCTLVGRAPADRTLAERVGFRYVDHEQFFSDA